MDGDRPRPRIPVATYRLQFNKDFGFAAARDILPYLRRLGITDVYASPCFAARKGSGHGYDVVDHGSLNPELGSREDYLSYCSELQRLGMGQILDFVPNHMCIESPGNRLWQDVLENGRSSPYAYFFDIDWEPVKKELWGKVLLPFLGDQYGTVLERGELVLSFENGAFLIRYYDAVVPLEPTTWLQILKYRPEQLDTLLHRESPARLEFLSIITALQHLPPPTEQDPDHREERYREKEIIKRRLQDLCAQSPQIADFLGRNIAAFNGTVGTPDSFNLLDALLREQPYRLSFWRVATEEINYRRFFDINGLAAIRMEDAAVFRHTHELLFQLIRDRLVTGLRLDHLDGLYDPAAYLKRLQRGCFVQLRLAADGGSEEAELVARHGKEFDALLEEHPHYHPFYVVGEKILLEGERIPDDWLLTSTTGYDFAENLNGVFIDAAAARAFDRIYCRFVRRPLSFREVSYRTKKLVMQVAMSGEIITMGHHLSTICERDRATRDFTRASLTRALIEVIACFPVYRSYTSSTSVRETDSRYIEEAIDNARRKNPALSRAVFDFLRAILLLHFPPYATEADRSEWLHFVMKFQQITGPVMAKGVEDTAFYLYNRLVSLNEVGGMPERFGSGIESFHGENVARLSTSPHAMITTSTHDSKHGSDFRARIDALSEYPQQWQKALTRWNRMNQGRKPVVEGQQVPDRNEEYLLYQILLGAWPPEGDGCGEEFRGRVKGYLTKALREAKAHSSWISPNIAYEEALSRFVDLILTEREENPFLGEFRVLQRQIAHCGLFNALSQTLLKMTSPGVPDFYQGSELWELTLVDPDNRRQVDYGVRSEALERLVAREGEIGAAALVEELLASRHDGRLKLYLIHRVLSFRGEHRALFERGEYLPLETRGERGRHICAFARTCGGEWGIVAVPRLVSGLTPEPGSAPLGEGAWLDTAITLPANAPTRYRNVFTEETVEAEPREGEALLSAAKVFARGPVALLAQ
ncbi:malto-oligosyltrehalose synthase [Geomonas sp. RF6]|uniref:malto-oligosyltrehalose synthase n=1 Tax=Geomonas sp. RF6 TaxID=2897342 RepID=UPI001E545FCC|nr:malto-oligosyltrehalose synthase [Geomonas sp. RF6]UFS69219.1 malto-oligosyltrehalose synthase [Geomonas sp. RF6]